MAAYRDPRRVRILKRISWFPPALIATCLMLGFSNGMVMLGSLAIPLGIYGGVACTKKAMLDRGMTLPG